MKSPRFWALAALAAALLLFASCADSTAQDSSLLVYTYDSFPQDVMDLMEQEMLDRHGVEVKFEVPGDAGSIFTRLSLEREAPRADVFIGLDQTYLAKLYEQNLALPYAGARELVAQSLWLDPQNRVTPFDYGYITLNINTADAPGTPATWQELLDPKFRSSIIMLNPAASSPGRNFLLFTVLALGQDHFLDYWRQLKPNILTVAPGWSEGYGLYSQGEAPFVVSYDTSPAAHRIFEDKYNFDSLRLGGQAYLQVEVAGIVQGTGQPELAGELIDILLSEEAQELLPLNQFMYPARTGTALPENFASAEGLPEGVMLDAAVIEANFDKWLADWQEVMR